MNPLRAIRRFGSLILEEMVSEMFEPEARKIQERIDEMQPRMVFHRDQGNKEIVAMLRNTYLKELNALAPLTRTSVYDKYATWLTEYDGGKKYGGITETERK